MLFNSLPFAVFLIALLAALRLVPRRAWPGLLLGASLVFYASWRPAYLLLLLADIGVNWLLLRAIVAGARPRAALAGSVLFTLGLLAFFKYAAFAVEALLPLLRLATDTPPPVPAIALPLGISFFSFQIIALAVDARRGQLLEVPSLRRYALFVSFFPQLIAGPILRGNQLLPQLERGAAPNPERTRRGVWLLASGLTKKVVLADFLLAGFADRVFDAPGVANGPFHLFALYSFAFQIYFDFSGYTDMARGIALLIGFELPLNFREPYLARSPTEFWRRWHITLSQWLRDYLYIPLGGNRRGGGRTLANLMITMALGGLWHGAAWNFAIWGAFHGALLIAHRLVGRGDDRGDDLGWSDAARIALVFHLVCLGWVFFRADGFADAMAYLGGFAGDWSQEWPWFQVVVVGLCMALHLAERRLRLAAPALQARLARWPWGPALEGAACGFVLALCVAFSGTGDAFIYFRF